MTSLNKSEGAAPWSASAPFTKNASPSVFNIQDETKNGYIEASDFLKVIVGEEGLTFQTFDDIKSRKDHRLCKILHGTLDQFYDQLQDLNDRGAGVFFTVNQTDLKGRRAENIVKVRAVFVDLDGSPLEPVLSSPLSPHIVVESSPDRYHAYWLINGLPIENFTQVQKMLIEKFNADPVVKDLPRVMRLPGFSHRKKIPYLVKVIHRSEAPPYQHSSFLSAFQFNLAASAISNGPLLGIDHDEILKELSKRKLVIGQIPNKQGAWQILCPSRDLHTTGDDGTVYFEPNTNGYKGAGFKCQHSHCSERGIEDLRKYLGLKAIDAWEIPVPLKENLFPVAPFKEEMLPDSIRPWITDNAERMQAPLDFFAASCVVALGDIIGRKAGIHPKAHDDWLVIPNLWGAIVGRPSLLKTPAIAEMIKPLDELALKASEKYQKQMEIHEQEKNWIDAKKAAQKEEMKKAAKKRSGDKVKPQFEPIESIKEPFLKRYMTEDGTIEKIGEILRENPQGILIHRDELIGWAKSLDKIGREVDRAFYLEAWNGNGSHTVDRIGRGTLHIPALCLSLIGGIQPGPLATYVHQATKGGAGDDGLLQRFQLLVWPDASKAWENVDRPPNIRAKEIFYEVFFNLDAFENFELTGDCVFKTKTLRFTSEAQDLFDEWRSNMESRLRNGELSPALESHLAKYRSLVPSLALIFYFVETVGRGETAVAVDAQAVRLALEWVTYLETHAKRLYASGEDPHMESARALLERIKRGDLQEEFSCRDVYNARHWSKLDTAEQVNNAIKILEDFGWVKTIEVKTSGRPSTKIIAHPDLRRGR